jgi:DNA repair protein RadC
MEASPKISLRDVPTEERPRERMQTLGAEALSNAELLAILLRTGSRSESVLHLSERLLIEAEGLRNLFDMSLNEMTSLHGIGLAKAIQVKAALELGKRTGSLSREERYVIRSPKDAAFYLMEEMRNLKKEHFVCLFLNMKNQVMGKETIFVGSLNASIVHPREIFRSAIKRSSASIICLHNHPSGDPTPSPEDIQVTKRLCEAGELMGIDVLDHIIIGDQTYISLKEKGLL